MSRIALADIRSLTFYEGAETKARRLSPIPQLKCVGHPCQYFKPGAVHCVNFGGEGAEIDWKCEADLPESLRFGAVEVSCEGWGYPGDEYVLKGSCALEYRLVQIPTSKNPYPRSTSSFSWFLKPHVLILFAVAAYIVYRLLKLCPLNIPPLRSQRHATQRRSSPWNTTPRDPPPPPYSNTYPGPWDNSQPGNSTNSSQSFWTGVGLGGLGGAAAAQYFGARNREPHGGRLYDWETPIRPQRQSPNVDRGEGPSRSMGSSSRTTPTRRSVGYGRTSVR